MKKNFLLFISSVALLLAVFVFNPNFVRLFSGQVGANPGCADSCFDASSTGLMDTKDVQAKYEGTNINVPAEVLANDERHNVLGTVSDIKWIEVDLSEQKLYAWEGDKLYLETLVSTGLPGTPTPTGEFRIWIKLRATKMEGGSGRGYYYLPNVPYVMFFENADVPGWRGYSLHGTYWHDDFGTPHSHGCVNLPTPVAKQLYEWTSPVLPEGKSIVRSTDDNPGTRILVHQ